jgi:hypothetical protein
MSFGITPTQGFNPPTPKDFPDYMQFQAAGVDLGDRAVDTLNFGANLTATRGTGEAANVVMVEAAGGGGGGVPVLVVELVGATQGVMNGALFSDWNGTPATASADAQWSQPDKAIKFLKTGIYRIQITAQADTGSGWPTDQTWVGSDISEDLSVERTVYARHDGEFVATESTVGWSDDFVVNIVAVNHLIPPKVYGNAYVNSATLLNFRGRVTVQRLGDSILA